MTAALTRRCQIWLGLSWVQTSSTAESRLQAEIAALGSFLTEQRHLRRCGTPELAVTSFNRRWRDPPDAGAPKGCVSTEAILKYAGGAQKAGHPKGAFCVREEAGHRHDRGLVDNRGSRHSTRHGWNPRKELAYQDGDQLPLDSSLTATTATDRHIDSLMIECQCRTWYRRMT